MYYFIEYDSDNVIHLEINGQTKEEVVEKVKEFHTENNWFIDGVYSLRGNDVYVCCANAIDKTIRVGYIVKEG